jgi:hypothetical protein
VIAFVDADGSFDGADRCATWTVEDLQAALDQGEPAGCPNSLETIGAVLAERWQPA